MRLRNRETNCRALCPFGKARPRNRQSVRFREVPL